MTNEENAVIAAFVNGVPGDEIFARVNTWESLREQFPLGLAVPVLNDIEVYRKDR